MQPTSPDPKFDFMLKNNATPKRGLPLPNLPKPLKIGLGVILGVILLIVISSALSGRNKGAYASIDSSLARGQEIIRVTQLVQQQLPLQDPTTKAVAATTYGSLSSDQKQLITYLAGLNGKVNKVQLAADTDKTTDSQLQTASQNNNLDEAYKTYLRESLAKYASDLQTAYNSAGPKGKTILKAAYDSTSTLLSNPPLK